MVIRRVLIRELSDSLLNIEIATQRLIYTGSVCYHNASAISYKNKAGGIVRTNRRQRRRLAFNAFQPAQGGLMPAITVDQINKIRVCPTCLTASGG